MRQTEDLWSENRFSSGGIFSLFSLFFSFFLYGVYDRARWKWKLKLDGLSVSDGFIKDHYRVFGDVESMIIGLRTFMQTNIFVSVISVVDVIIIVRFILCRIFQVFFYFEFRVLRVHKNQRSSAYSLLWILFSYDKHDKCGCYGKCSRYD